MYFHIDDIEKSKKFDSIKETFDIQLGILHKEEISSRKLEEKASMLTNGYIKRFNVITKKFDGLVTEIGELKMKKKVYEELKLGEDYSMLKRKRYYEDSIDKIKEQENIMQERYKRYQDRINELENL